MPSLVLPLLIQVALTFYLLARTAQSRIVALRSNGELMKRTALNSEGWPEKPRQFANCYSNQFELPVLFYLVIVLYMVTGGAGVLMPVLAWIFVALRILHMVIHTTSNNVRQRFYAFAAGMVAVLAMWVVFALHYFL